MSTRETMAHRETELLALAPERTASRRERPPLLLWPVLQKLAYLGGDLLAITVAHMLAVRIVEHFLRVPAGVLNPFDYHRFYIPFFAVVLYLVEGYKSPELRRPELELQRDCEALAVSFLSLVLFNLDVFRSQAFSRYLLMTWFVLACVLLLTLRFTLRAINERLWRAGLCRRRAVLLGSPAGFSSYLQLLAIQKHYGYELVGVLQDGATPPHLAPEMLRLPVLGSREDWENVLASTCAPVLIVVDPASADGEDWLGKLLRRCKQLRVDVELYSSVLATANLNFEHDEFSGCLRFYAKPQWSLAVQRLVKRGLDLVIGLIGSAVTLLLTPIVFVFVNLEDRGPVFYKREFVGSDGNIHYYRKFRTMLKNADDILRGDPELKSKYILQYKLKDDPRVLRVGQFMRRYSLDEFPQFFSVLSGELTFVGPRPISSEEKHCYGILFPKLLSFKPGLTGFWQVMGRQTTTYQERVRLDMFYIDRWSIWLDLVIIAKTVWKVLKAEGAY